MKLIIFQSSFHLGNNRCWWAQMQMPRKVCAPVVGNGFSPYSKSAEWSSVKATPDEPVCLLKRVKHSVKTEGSCTPCAVSLPNVFPQLLLKGTHKSEAFSGRKLQSCPVHRPRSFASVKATLHWNTFKLWFWAKIFFFTSLQLKSTYTVRVLLQTHICAMLRLWQSLRYFFNLRFNLANTLNIYWASSERWWYIDNF